MYKFSSPPFELFPTETQKILIYKHNGCCRYVWNWALALMNYNWEQEKRKPKDDRKILKTKNVSAMLTAHKKEKIWLNDVNSQSLVAKLNDLNEAFKKFYSNCKKKAKGKKGYPRFKTQDKQQSFQSQQSKSEEIVDKCQECKDKKRSKQGCKSCVRKTLAYRQNRVKDLGNGFGLLYIPKFSEGIKIRLHKKIEGDIGTITIRTTPTGRFFATICETRHGEFPEKSPIVRETTLGIDDGLTHYIMCDNGTTYENKKYLYKSEAKIKYLGRKLQKKRNRLFATCQKCGLVNKNIKHLTKHWKCTKCGQDRKLKDIYISKKYNNLKLKLARAHEKITWQRKDHINKTTHDLTTNEKYDTIATQPMNVKGMVKNHKLAKGISDVSWSETHRQLKYKCDREGKNFIQCDRFDPTTKTCWNETKDGICGYINEDLTLADREWDCPKCGTHHHRDINAANGIKICALKKVGFGAT